MAHQQSSIFIPNPRPARVQEGVDYREKVLVVFVFKVHQKPGLITVHHAREETAVSTLQP